MLEGNQFEPLDELLMRRALELARCGEGHVEPNPMVGCVIAQGGRIVAEGWHRRWGGPHAEVEALANAAEAARDSTLYVTLEPCCHQGKTPPCTQAILEAGVRRVVAAQSDPFPAVRGQGLRALEDAGLEVVSGVLAKEAEVLNAPYLKRLHQGLPWVIAKWAMTLDGRLSSRTGDSKWISNLSSRKAAHELRGRMDAIVVGSATANRDDPLLTARPAGPRVPLRIVLDSQGRLGQDSQLARTARETPVLVAVSSLADQVACRRLRALGIEVFHCSGDTYAERLRDLLAECGRRDMTNVLIEGGGVVLGSAFDADVIDEVHLFIAPKLVGGDGAAPCAGAGAETIADGLPLGELHTRFCDGDLYVWGRIEREVR